MHANERIVVITVYGIADFKNALLRPFAQTLHFNRTMKTTCMKLLAKRKSLFVIGVNRGQDFATARLNEILSLPPFLNMIMATRRLGILGL